MTFTTKFDNYVCTGDTIECTVGDTTYIATIHADLDASIDDDDIHSYAEQSSAEALERVRKVREAYNNNHWFYCGVVLSAQRDGWTKDNLISLWGIECNYPDGDNDYLSEVSRELLAEYLS